MVKKTTLGIIISTILLTGCGTDSNDSAVNPTPPTKQNHLLGTAATGAPITGLLKLRDAEGEITEYAVKDQGTFDINSASSIKTPAVLQIVGGSGGRVHELYSILVDNEDLNDPLATRVVNVTPLTQLLISHATGVSAPAVFASDGAYNDKLTLTELKKSQDELKTVLSKLLLAAKLDPDFDLLSSQFEADNTNIDAVLDLLEIKFTDTEAVITYRANRDYSVTLPYGTTWSQLSLLPKEMSTEDAQEALSYLVTADTILEKMILQRDEESYMKYVHPDAVSFGAKGNDIWAQKKVVINDEIDPNMDRYRDLSLMEVDNTNQRFLISFTERYENSDFASGGRSHAWFAKDTSGKFKFLGENKDLPIYTSMYLKMDTNDRDYVDGRSSVEFSDRFWGIQINAFPSQAVCETFSAPEGGWQWGEWGDNAAFRNSLPDVSEQLGFDYMIVTGPGIAKPLKLDKVFKTEASGENKLASCHLVSSEYSQSPVISGYTLASQSSIYNFNYPENFDFENPAADFVPDNSTYTLTYYKDNKELTELTTTVNIGKGISPWSEMSPLLSHKKELRRTPGDFYYQWDRVSELVTDTDLWVYKRFNQIGAGDRVSLAPGAKSVARSSLEELAGIFHSSFDQYGRVINHGYLLIEEEKQ